MPNRFAALQPGVIEMVAPGVQSDSAFELIGSVDAPLDVLFPASIFITCERQLLHLLPRGKGFDLGLHGYGVAC